MKEARQPIENSTGSHLEQIYGDRGKALLYDFAYTLTETRDVEFWKDIAVQVKPNRILEIGVGTGRIAATLAREGYEVVGIDIERPMLDVAREKDRGNGKLDLIQADATSISFPGQFDLVTVPLNTFNHFIEREDQVKVLRNIYDSLTPDGVFVLDMWNPTSKVAQTWNTEKQGEPDEYRKPVQVIWATDEKTGLVAARLVMDYFDEASDLFYADRITTIYDKDKRDVLVADRFKVPMKIYSFFEFMNVAKETGNSDGSIHVLGGYEGHPYMDFLCLTSGHGIKGAPSEKMIIVGGPGQDRVRPKPVSPEMAETLTNKY